MLKQYSINKLLHLPDNFSVYEKIIGDETLMYISLQQQAHTCPQCGATTNRVHDYREQPVDDIPLLGNRCKIIFRKRRYVCTKCGKRFYENNPLLSRYKRQTNRFRLHILGSFSDVKTTTQIASDNFISSGIANRILKQIKYPKPSTLPRVIAIDEFRGNVGSKFQCLLVDPLHHRTLDVLPTRDSEDLHAYFNQIPMKVRKRVRYIIMDLSTMFRSVMKACFPKAKIIADKFHTVRLITWALDGVRKEVQKKFAKHRRISFKKSKAILLKRQNKLTDEEKERLTIMLQASDQLRIAYHLKELFYDVMDSATRAQFNARLNWFIFEVEELAINEFTRHLDTLRKWRKEIELAVLSGCSNGYIEGCNNRIKVLKRACYGFRNFNIFRNRMLYIANNTRHMRKNRRKIS